MAQRIKWGEIDLNRADAQQLMAIEGIDGERARALIDWRRAHGGFRSIDEIDGVRGFDGALRDRVKAAAFVGGERRRSRRREREARPDEERGQERRREERGVRGRARDETRIDLNTAGAEELGHIEGVDGERAEAILRYRGEHGPFRSWRDVGAVPGVDGVTVQRIRAAARIGPEWQHEEHAPGA